MLQFPFTGVPSVHYCWCHLARKSCPTYCTADGEVCLTTQPLLQYNGQERKNKEHHSTEKEAVDNKGIVVLADRFWRTYQLPILHRHFFF